MNILFSEAKEKFIKEAVIFKKSPNTIRNYKNTFKKFIACIGDKQVDKITEEDLIDFFEKQSNLSGKTLLNYHSDLSAFFNWAIQKGYCKENPIQKIIRPKANSRVIIPLEEHEVDKVIDCAKNTKSPEMDYAIMCLLFDTGIRASELCNIKLCDINMNKNYIRILGKGGKERCVPFCEDTKNAILKYLGTRPNVENLDYLFVDPNNKPIDRHQLLHKVKEIGNLAGIPRLHPHLCRHTFAVDYIRNGGDIYSLQSILGHSNTEMVKHYVVLAKNDILRSHAKASPIKNALLRKGGDITI